ncbi:MAG: hypothetical protein DRG39_04050 [Deltaproteobacteria bacterium]|nr:MAG: hypothetical protein DRG39_04050 [Deltaproteobacteria bacterium]
MPGISLLGYIQQALKRAIPILAGTAEDLLRHNAFAALGHAEALLEHLPIHQLHLIYPCLMRVGAVEAGNRANNDLQRGPILIEAVTLGGLFGQEALEELTAVEVGKIPVHPVSLLQNGPSGGHLTLPLKMHVQMVQHSQVQGLPPGTVCEHYGIPGTLKKHICNEGERCHMPQATAEGGAGNVVAKKEADVKVEEVIVLDTKLLIRLPHTLQVLLVLLPTSKSINGKL